jgi:hypothetical protein
LLDITIESHRGESVFQATLHEDGLTGFANPLRVTLPKGLTGLNRASDILVDPIKAIDNRRLRRELGPLPDPYLGELRRKLLLVLDYVEESLSI